MTDTSSKIEERIREFVGSKTGEPIVIDLSRPQIITIKHRSKAGSTALGWFWARVLQHPNNYPVSKYPYRDMYHESTKVQKLILKVDDVSITVYMTNGTLTIQGVFVIEWFVEKFATLMSRYNAIPDQPQPIHTDLFVAKRQNWEKVLQADQQARDSKIKKEREVEEAALKILDEIKDGKDLNGCGSRDSNENKSDKQLADLVEVDTAADKLSMMRLDTINEDSLDTQLQKLQQGSIEDGPTCIYPLWKSLLDEWFSDPDNKVYIVTPFLDTDRLTDICHSVLKNRLTANLEALYVRLACDHDRRTVSDVRRNTQNRFDEKDKVFIEYKVYSNIVYPVKRFHCKFIACVNKTKAKVLLTSANFHADHFVHPNLETVSYLTMTGAEFTHRFLRLIQASQLDVKS